MNSDKTGAVTQPSDGDTVTRETHSDTTPAPPTTTSEEARTMAAEQDSLPVGRLFVIGFSGIVITYIIVLLQFKHSSGSGIGGRVVTRWL